MNLAFREAIAQGFGAATDFPPATTPAQLYRQVREYRDRYPDKAIVAWNAGVGPAPILMAGGAQCLNRNPTAGHAQNTIDRVPLDPLVQKYLPSTLMNLIPRDGLLANPDTTWCLSDDSNKTLLVYSLQSAAIAFVQPLGKSFTANWLDPRTGTARPLAQPININNRTTIPKPTSEDWLLLMRSSG